MSKSIVISIFVMLINSDVIKLFQLNGYKFVVDKNILKSIAFKLIASIAYVILIVLARYFFEILFGLIILTSIYIFSSNKNKRGRVKITKRLIRILIVSFAFNAGAMYFLSTYIGSILILIEYFILLLSNILLSPIEFIIQRFYIHKAKTILKKKNPLVIAITGSFGKTTTKYILKSILSSKYKVITTPKNYNTLMGVCKAINDIKDEEIFIVEMGARKKGDIKKICKLVNPKYGIITGVCGQHLQTFKTIENVYKTKKELVDFIGDKGIVVFNDKNELAKKMMQDYTGEKSGIRDFDIKNIEILDENQSFKLVYKENEYLAKTNLFGESALEDILIAISMSLKLNISILECLDKIAHIDGIDNRFTLKKLSNDITLIDDSYNANFEGAIKAIDYLKHFNQRRVIFSQGIVELGLKQKQMNIKLGEKMAKIADLVILLGVNSAYIKCGLLKSNFKKENIIILKNFSECKNIFANYLKGGDVLLIQNDLTDNY